MKVVINEKTGGFSLSNLAVTSYYEAKGYKKVVWNGAETSGFFDPKNPDGDYMCGRDIPRHDPDFVKIVEELGERAHNPGVCRLKIIDIPDGVEYIICEAGDGAEWIAEKHRTWN